MLLRKEIKESEAYKLEKEARGASEFPGCVPLETGGKMPLRSISFFLASEAFFIGFPVGTIYVLR
jgi:hypothetical protein